MSTISSTARICFSALVLGLLAGPAAAEIIPFDDERWDLEGAQIVSHLERQSLIGVAVIEDLEFENGVIEFDIAVSGARSYPGVIFRMQSEKDYERVYVRPHRAGLYPDALQYVPSINGIAGWQLYHGEGLTAGAEIPENRWVHFKLEVHGSQARVWLEDAAEPALVINELKHGLSRGTIGLLGPTDGTAHFSNFSYRIDESLEFAEASEKTTAPGALTNWQLSRSYKTAQVNRERYPLFFQLFAAGWREIMSEPSGLVDIARYAGREGREADCVFARIVFEAEREERLKLSFGYSDDVTVFHNGRPVFFGNSAYRSRDRSFVGVVGLHDTLYLDLTRGLNEIFLIVSESFGGWGFIVQADRELQPPTKQHELLTKLWETPDSFLTPESVLYDPARRVLYVTNFDFRLKPREPGADPNSGYVSKLDLNGEIIDQHWVTGLRGPAGLAISGDRLYVVERGNLVEIDLESGEILKRYPVPGSNFLNDVIADSSGTLYISDTFSAAPSQSRIYRFSEGEFDLWEGGSEINRANGLWIQDDSLLVGNSGDGCLKSIDLAGRKIETKICLGAGIMDGIRIDASGNYLLSLWKGKIYRASPAGAIVEILDTGSTGLNAADFEYIEEQQLLIVPTFSGNRVVAYRLEQGS